MEVHIAWALTSRRCRGCREQIRLWLPFRPAVGNYERTLSMGFPNQVRDSFALPGNRGRREGSWRQPWGVSGWEQVVGADVFCGVESGSQLRGVQREEFLGE